MNEINNKLERLEQNNERIVVGLVGAGQMGKEIVAQIGEMVGMDVAVIVDVSTENAQAGFQYTKRKSEVVCTDDPEQAEKAIQAGNHIAATDYRVATRLPSIHAVVDATGSSGMGAIISLDAIDHGKNIVMMNVECDVTVGPLLRQWASNAGVVYSIAAGDEPGAIMELYRFAKTLGFEIVAAGKGKNNPLDLYATPDTVRETADKRQMSAKMLCEFVDGSKTAVEMTAVSNMTGLVPDVRGMHGPKATIETIEKVFIPKEDGGVFEKSGCVDFGIGIHPGVFVVARTDNPRIQFGMHDRDMGPGPYYRLYRPYHLCSVEVPLTIAAGVFYGESSGHPMRKPVSETIAVAKRDLEPGEKLDRIGEYMYRGSIELAPVAREERLLPLGLAEGCTVRKKVPADSYITYDMVDTGDETTIMQLRRLQDQVCWS